LLRLLACSERSELKLQLEFAKEQKEAADKQAARFQQQAMSLTKKYRAVDLEVYNSLQVLNQTIPPCWRCPSVHCVCASVSRLFEWRTPRYIVDLVVGPAHPCLQLSSVCDVSTDQPERCHCRLCEWRCAVHSLQAEHAALQQQLADKEQQVAAVQQQLQSLQQQLQHQQQQSQSMHQGAQVKYERAAQQLEAAAKEHVDQMERLKVGRGPANTWFCLDF
jgi:hypothetical protein